MEKLYAFIESPSYKHQANSANSFANFIKYFEASPVYGEIIDAYIAQPASAISALQKRINEISKIKGTPNYVHPYDVTLACYLYLIYKLEPTVFSKNKIEINLPPVLLWTRIVLGLVESQQPAAETFMMGDSSTVDSADMPNAYTPNANSASTNMITGRRL